MNDVSEYLRILQLYGQVVDSLKGFSPSDRRLVYAQTLALKLFDHAASVYSLADGTDMSPILGMPGQFIHVASLEVLARAVLETYLLFHYIFVDPETDDEFEFRYCAWLLSGGAKREKFVTDFPPQTPGGQECLVGQVEFNSELRARIQQTSEFKSHSPKTQRRLLAGQWRFPKWVDIAKSAGIGQQYSRLLFALLSDYAHSGGLSALQLGSSMPIEDRYELVQTTLRQVKSIISKMMVTYIERFPEAKEALKNDPEAARLAHVYAGALGMVR